MEMYGKIQCVTFPELVTEGNILSVPNYKRYVRAGHLNILQRACRGRIALIEYNSMPERIKAAYDERYPHAKEQLKEKFMSEILRNDTKAFDFYRRYTLADGSGLTDKKQAEYVLNAQVMNEMIRVEKETAALHAKCGYSRREVVWNIVLGTCEKLRARYGHTLPRNSARLREKFNAYKKQGYPALISGKVGNQNTRKIGSAEARLLLKLKRSKFPVYTDMQIFEEFNRQSAAKGLNGIKAFNTLRNYLYAKEVMPMWYATVYGMKEWKAKYTSQLRTKMPSMRDSLWYSDGTKLNLYYRDANKKMCTTSVYEVMDAYSEVFLGYDIAPGETFDSQYRAFRMAVETSGVRPYEIVNDNQGGHKKLAAQGFFQKIAVLYKNTMPYNGQSKTIESVFGRFQSQILHKIWNFTGQNVTTNKLNSRPNLEFIEQNAYALPTLEEMKKIYKECRDEWNNAPHPATGIPRIEMYRMSANPETQPVTAVDLIQMFWLTSNKPVTYTNKGLKITINKEAYEYDVYGEDGMRNESWALVNTGGQFRVVYDPMDMTRVELWEETPSGLRYSTDATPKVAISRGTQERTSEESSFMRRTIERSKETMALIQLSTEDFDLNEGIAAELFGLSTPKPKHVSGKLMDDIRDKYEAGKLKAPISLPEKQAWEEQEENTAMEYATTGEYTKIVSNLDYSDIDRLERM